MLISAFISAVILLALASLLFLTAAVIPTVITSLILPCSLMGILSAARQCSLPLGYRKIRCLYPWGLMLCAYFFHLLRNIYRPVTIHLDDPVCNVEKSTGASGYQNRRNPGLLIQITGSLQKRCDRLFFPADDLLHQVISDHEIGSRGIFIN